MAKKIEKTNAARLLDKAKISYNLIPYEFDENDLAAQHVADSLGQDIAKVFKTLVLHGDKTGYVVCVIPGDKEVDLKGLAKVSGNKKVEMIPNIENNKIIMLIIGNNDLKPSKVTFTPSNVVPIASNDTPILIPIINIGAPTKRINVAIKII